MQAALIPDRNILCDKETFENTQYDFSFTELPAIRLKGVADPIAIFVPAELTTVEGRNGLRKPLLGLPGRSLSQHIPRYRRSYSILSTKSKASLTGLASVETMVLTTSKGSRDEAKKQRESAPAGMLRLIREAEEFSNSSDGRDFFNVANVRPQYPPVAGLQSFSDRLKDGLEATLATGDPEIVVVEGEAGLGKTALVYNFMSYLDSKRVEYAYAESEVDFGPEASEGHLFGPWRHLTQQIFDSEHLESSSVRSVQVLLFIRKMLSTSMEVLRDHYQRSGLSLEREITVARRMKHVTCTPWLLMLRNSLFTVDDERKPEYMSDKFCTLLNVLFGTDIKGMLPSLLFLLNS
jgi:hypothetical protein